MNEDDRKQILRRRRIIFVIIVAIIITILELWQALLGILLAGIFFYVIFRGFLFIVDWMSGNDLGFSSRKGKPGEHNQGANDIENTMWDIYNTDQTIRHEEDKFH